VGKAHRKKVTCPKGRFSNLDYCGMRTRGSPRWTTFELFAWASSLVRVQSGSPNVPVFEPQKRAGEPHFTSRLSTRTGELDGVTADTSKAAW
jgi:hypothetical protein